MPELDPIRLKEELDQFKREKEKIRQLMGQIGGKNNEKRDKRLNVMFIILIVELFLGDVARHMLHIDIPLPPLFSLEIGVLLVSIKIIWMMHKSTKVEHFQFWILNSIEFRLNDIAKQIRKLENEVGKSYELKTIPPEKAESTEPE
ncbi:MAG: hypothetical protein K9M45_08255 [Kiritimatiellales bacterium]|nr:hypothetical protein [Kiritimatiellales bacterium]